MIRTILSSNSEVFPMTRAKNTLSRALNGFLFVRAFENLKTLDLRDLRSHIWDSMTSL